MTTSPAGSCEPVEPDQVEHELRSLDELGAEGSERRSETSPCTGSANVPVRSELGHRREPPLELVDGGCVGALLGGEHPGGATLAEQRVANVACGANRQIAQTVAEHTAHPDAPVDGRRPADADDK